MKKWREYYLLTKPGIVRGNMLSLIAGYLLAATLYGFDGGTLVGVVCGTALVIASGCVFNNYLDRAIDRKMERTKRRALVQGTISPGAALLYGSLLTLLGHGLLWLLVNPLTTLLGCIGFVWYVLIYGYAKRTTSWSTLIGSVCGALPPVAGYTAIAGRIDAAAVILFVILVVWQMPHFYAIAIRRQEEYRAGGVPIITVTRGIGPAKWRIVAYIAVFCLVAPLLSVFEYTGVTYAALSVGLGVYWLTTAIRTWHESDTKKWAGRQFGVSLLVLLLISASIALGHLLP